MTDPRQDPPRADPARLIGTRVVAETTDADGRPTRRGVGTTTHASWDEEGRLHVTATFDGPPAGFATPGPVIVDDPAGVRYDHLKAVLDAIEHHGPGPAEVAMRGDDQAALARWWNARQAERDPLAGDLTRPGVPGLGGVRVVLDESVPHGTFELRDRDGRRVGGTAPPRLPPAYVYDAALADDEPRFGWWLRDRLADAFGIPVDLVGADDGRDLRALVGAYMATAHAYEVWAAGNRAGAPSDPAMAAAVARFAAPRRHDAAHADIVDVVLDGPSRTHAVTYRSHGMSSMTVVEDWQGGHDHPPVTRRPTVGGRPNPCQGLPRTHTGGRHPREAVQSFA